MRTVDSYHSELGRGCEFVVREGVGELGGGRGGVEMGGGMVDLAPALLDAVWENCILSCGETKT